MANTKIYVEQGGERMVVGDGAALVIEGDLEVAGGGEITPGPDSITTEMLQDECVTADKLDDDAVGTLNIIDGAVDTDKALVYISIETTATGSAQPFTHGLGVSPLIVLVVPSDNSSVMDGLFTITFTKNATTIEVTATTGLKYRVFAWA